MALVKKTKIGTRVSKRTASIAAPTSNQPAGKPLTAAIQNTRVQAVAERIGAATEELASGLAEASAATSELGQSMAQIAAGAEEAASASQEQSTAIKRIVASLTNARAEAEASNRRTDAVALSLTETTAQIAASVRAIERGAERQSQSAIQTAELERRAKDIGEITRVVSRISDQTNLLALNAAIEAARAGDHGLGFAVVADEVRSLAATSDKSARDVQALTEAIQKDVLEVGNALKAAAERAAGEAKAAAMVIEAFDARRQDMVKIAEGSQMIVTATSEAERAAIEAQKGAEQVASAAEEQSSGVTEAQVAVEQQAKSLNQSQAAAQGLSALGQELGSGKVRAATAEQIGASAEELSASIQELSSAAAQIMASVEQINRASQLQSAATQETSAALNQIESSARSAQQNSKLSSDRIQSIESAILEGLRSVDGLVNGVGDALRDTHSSLATMKRLEGVSRRVEKIIDAISLIAVQTSMLAVSGAVEAARAGDAGRGFAVVSNDIRSLAREASANVERASDTVRGILDQITSLKNDLEQVASLAEIEVQNNRIVSTSLNRIGKDVAALSSASKSISDGADDILAMTQEIGKAARQIATAAEEANAASRGAATAATEQSGGAEDLAAAIEEIASLADELKQQSA